MGSLQNGTRVVAHLIKVVELHLLQHVPESVCNGH
jgi:hypothetical protein